MRDEDQSSIEPDRWETTASDHPGPEPATAHAPQHAFEVPHASSHIQFKRVRRSTAESADRKRQPRTGALSRVRRWHLAVPVVVALLIGVGGVGWVGFHGQRAADHLRTAAQLFAQMQRQLESGDLSAAKTTLPALQQEIKAARAETAGESWRLASDSPMVGDDLSAVRTVSVALDDLATRALPPLLDVAASLEAALLTPKDGQVDLTTLQAATARLADAETIVRQARERVTAIPTKGLAPQIRSAMPALVQGLRRAEQVIGPAQRTARLLPVMLGAAGPRTYLVLFQNLAEVRATGGMPGAYIVIQADHGTVKIVDQGTATNLGTFDDSVLPLDPDVEDLHTARLGLYPADVNLTPDFPTAATLAREMYRLRSGRTVDGVMATDPVALSYLLRATGPVPVAAGPPLTAETAVRRLLNEVYLTMPVPAQQDAFFASAARAVFDVLISRQGDPRAVLKALAAAAGERRLLVWSSHPEEQQEIAPTMLSGQLPIEDGPTPTVGVFLNDGSGAKLSYYLTHSASLSVGECMEDGAVELRLKVTVGSTAPASGLPPSVLGMGLSGSPYTVRTNVMVYSPTGGGLVEASLDGDEVDMGSGVEGERSVAVVTVDLPPGVTRTLDVVLLTDVLPADGTATTRPRLWTTPGVAPWHTTVTSGPGCRR